MSSRGEMFVGAGGHYHPAPGAEQGTSTPRSPAARPADGPRRPRILVVTSHDEHFKPPIGIVQRLIHHLAALRAIGDVTVFTPTPLPTGWTPAAGEPPDPAVHMEAAANAAAACWDITRHRPDSPAAWQLAEQQPQRYDVVVIQRLHHVWWTGWTDPARTIVDIDDLSSHHFRQLAAQPGNSPATRWQTYLRVRAAERRLPGAFRFIVVCSEEDRAEFHQPNVIAIPNVFRRHPLMGALDPRRASSAILCLSTLSFAPNAQGAQWFIRHVLPAVRAQRPGVELIVAGFSPPGLAEGWPWTRAEGVRYLGPVDDVGPLYEQAALTICPIDYGRGTRIRITESLAFGVPVVSSSIGAHGLRLDASHGVHRADNAADFAQACVQLLTPDPGRAARIDAGRAAAEAAHSPEVSAAGWRRMVEAILAAPAPA